MANSDRQRPPSVDFFYEDFFAGTAGLHPIAGWIYTRCLCFQWINGFVPKDERQLCRITGVLPDELAEHWPQVVEKFEELEDGSGYINLRAKSEMDKKLHLKSTRSQAGKKGALLKQTYKQTYKQTTKQNASKPSSKPTSKTGSKRGSKTQAQGSRKKEVGSRKMEVEGSTRDAQHLEVEQGDHLDGPDLTKAVDLVVAHYRVYHERASPGEKERSKIRARLKDGYSVRDLRAAIDGCHRSPYHCGENENGRKYQSLELIMRDSSKVQQFLEVPQHGAEPVLSTRSQRNKRAANSFLQRRLGGEFDHATS